MARLERGVVLHGIEAGGEELERGADDVPRGIPYEVADSDGVVQVFDVAVEVNHPDDGIQGGSGLGCAMEMERTGVAATHT